MENHIYEWGDREKQTLVFLHGLGSTGLSFGELAKFLEGYHVVSFDIAGHGHAKPFLKEQDYLPSRMTKEIGKFVRELDKPDIFLIGHSWGANLALYFARSYPEQIQGVILIDGGYLQESELGSLQEELGSIEQFHNNVRFSSWEDFIESEKNEMHRWSDELEAASRSQVMESNGEIHMVTTVFTAKAILKGMYAEPTVKIFSEITVPVLLLRSTLPKEMENLRVEAADLFQKKVSNSEIRIIPNTTHDLYRDAPEEVAENIRNWIGKIK